MNPMQDDPMNLAHVLEHAARFHGQVEIVTRTVEDGALHRSTYADAYQRAQKLAAALRGLGVQSGDRIATLGWNTLRHFEAWYAIAGQGAICHTVNPRLFEDQIVYIINHAEDRILLLDLTFVPLIEKLQDQLPSIEHYIVMTDQAHLPASELRGAVAYETLIDAESGEFDWPSFPEDTPSSLCYTSGTTGNPKGVLYTHRSNFLHAYACNGKNAIGVSSDDTVLMVVPMFHANSWGLVYSCPMVGAPLVLPGPKLDGESVFQLLDGERVTISAGVPTVWSGLLAYLKSTGATLPHLKEIVNGGSALPRSLFEAYDRDHGVEVVHGWGMTELSPIGTVCRLKPCMVDYSYQQKVEVRLKQGFPLFGVSMKIVDDDGNELEHDGKTSGRLLVKGPWIVKRYYRDESDAVDAEGWFDTGDIATIDQHGYMQITDRAKDLIKSGGEWISSVDLENAAVGHPGVAVAAAIGVYHPKWEERPLLVIQRAEDTELSGDEVIDFLRDKVARWWLPDDVVFVDEIPLTAAGKISKRTLREQFSDYQLPTV
jgi:fatty-acyl-CoA synthase